MADSTRKKVVDAIVAAAKVTGVRETTDDPKVWAEIAQKNLPRIFVNMGAVTSERFAYPHATSPDMLAEADATLDGVVQTRTPGTLITTMDGIMAALITAIEAVTVSGVTIMESVLVSLDYDKDQDANYGIFRAVFRVRYLYNHLVP